jgi:hypothetical protein
MKRYLLILTLVFLLLTACVQDSVEPPELKIGYGDQEITAVTGTYGWTENSKHIESDSDIPPNIVDFQNDNLTVEKGALINLVFKKTPEDVQVNIWENDKPVGQDIEDNQLIVPDKLGEIVYEVIADYNQGTVHYAFEAIVEN